MIKEQWSNHRRNLKLFICLLLLPVSHVVDSAILHYSPSLLNQRSNVDKRARQSQQGRRHLQQKPNDPYFSTNDTGILGAPNYMAALGNPLKGLTRFGSRHTPETLPQYDSVPSAIEFFSIGLDDIMTGDNQFNWTTHDHLLEGSASRDTHVVLSVFIHWPGEPLRIPPHLIDIEFYETNHGFSPNYGEPKLLTALQQFIVAWGQHIDGDKRLAAVHVGLLGFWGEGHTYPDTTLVPEASKVAVAQWYRDAFNTTQVQARYPGPNSDGLGLFDASLGYSTLDGAANGGVDVDWFMYPQIVQANQQNSWTDHMIGGETRPELQSIIFTDLYPASTENHQDLKNCIDALHVTYILHHGAFENGGYSGAALDKAKWFHAYMGYSFYVSKVDVSETAKSMNTNTTKKTVDVSVQITQSGIAPFYYDLRLQLSCNRGMVQMEIAGVDSIIYQWDSMSFVFRNVPATIECLNEISLSLQSSYVYPNRPIRFAQGTNGTKVVLAIPLPPMVEYDATALPIPVSTQIPTNSPTMTFDASPTSSNNYKRIITVPMIQTLVLLIKKFPTMVHDLWKRMINF